MLSVGTLALTRLEICAGTACAGRAVRPGHTPRASLRGRFLRLGTSPGRKRCDHIGLPAHSTPVRSPNRALSVKHPPYSRVSLIAATSAIFCEAAFFVSPAYFLVELPTSLSPPPFSAQCSRRQRRRAGRVRVLRHLFDLRSQSVRVRFRRRQA